MLFLYIVLYWFGKILWLDYLFEEFFVDEVEINIKK